MAEEKSITDQKEEEKSTLEYAMELVRKKGQGYNDWKIKSLGLQFVLLALAEIQSERLIVLSESNKVLEKKVFDEQNLRELSVDGLFRLYKASAESIKDITGYIRETLDRVDWQKIEADLITIKAKSIESENIPADMTALAEALVKSMKSPIVDKKEIKMIKGKKDE